MRKVICYIIIVFLMCVPAFPQVNGIDLAKAKALTGNSKTFKNYEELLSYNCEYCITYPLAPIGLQHCMDKLKVLLSANGLEWTQTWAEDLDSSKWLVYIA